MNNRKKVNYFVYCKDIYYHYHLLPPVELFLNSMLENEIKAIKDEIEKSKIELIEAEKLRRQKLEYDVIAKQIVKLASRKRTQRYNLLSKFIVFTTYSQMDATKMEIEKLNEELLSLDQKIEHRKSQFYSLVCHMHEIKASIVNEQENTLFVTADDGDIEVDQVDEEGEINEDDR